MPLRSGDRISEPKLLWWACEWLLTVEVEEYLECDIVDCNEDVNEESELRLSLSEDLCFGDGGGVLVGALSWQISG